MQTVQPGEEQQNNREQGKLNTETIFRELTTTGKPKKLYEIALAAGSKAKSKKELATAVTQKVANSSELQLRLAKHYEETLQQHSQLSKSLQKRIIEKCDVDKLSPREAMDSFIKNGNLMHNLSKQTEKLGNTGTTNVQINIISNKDKDE